MSKFLQVVNENQPDNPHGIHFIKLTDDKGNEIDSIELRGTNYATDIFLQLKVKLSENMEDNEVEEVEKAGKLIKTALDLGGSKKALQKKAGGLMGIGGNKIYKGAADVIDKAERLLPALTKL